MSIKDILAPIDFSPGSLKALKYALSIIDDDGEICLLHVIDTGFISKLTEEGFCDTEAATSKLRIRAEERLKEIIMENSELKINIDSMVVVGRPFAEILRVSLDLDFTMIVLSAHGLQRGDVEGLLFGSTAEKVIRGARIPVLSVPNV
jgi:nucleotide-binding universal stress UspA family protein